MNKNIIFTIEKANVQDIESILQVQLSSWLDTYPSEEFNITVDDINIERALSPERINTNRERLTSIGTVCFKALVEGNIVGYSWPYVEEGKNRVGAIYLLPEYQGFGIGKALMEKVIKHYKGKEIYLECAIYNTKAIGFYKHFGFVEVPSKEQLFHKLKITGKQIPIILMKRNPQ